MKKIKIFFSVLFICLGFSALAHGEAQSPIYFNDKVINFENPVIREMSSTIVPVREFCEQAGFTVVWNGAMREVIVLNDEVKVIMTIGNNNIQVQSKSMGDYDVLAMLPPQINNSVTYIPLRAVAESLGAKVVWRQEDDSTHIITDKKAVVEEKEEEPEKTENVEKDEAVEEIVKEDGEEFKNTFYSQYDPEYIELYNDEVYKWTAGRNGYCYVTAYAMLISDISGVIVTPKEIADINLLAGENPSVCYHWDILGKYGRNFKVALSEESPYFVEYDASRGLTYIDNSSPENVIAAIKESLKDNTKGVMVRDLSMPHTMVAIGFDDEGIYFNDPALLEGGALWEETCLKNREITTISAIIALK